MASGDGRRRDLGKQVAILILVVLLLIVVAQNHTDTRVDVLFLHVTWPLWILLGGVGLVAFIAGWFAGRMRK